MKWLGAPVSTIRMVVGLAQRVGDEGISAEQDRELAELLAHAKELGELQPGCFW